MNSRFRVVFMGCPDFSLPALRALADDPRFELVAVFSMPDKPKGRGHQLAGTPVKEEALKRGIPVLTPASFRKDPAAVQQLRDFAPDFLVVIAYGLILPQEVLDIPRIAPINVHASLLPRYRGPAPIHFALLRGDEVTGNTIMFMNARMDEGDILATQELPIHAGENLESLHDRLASAGAPLLLKTLVDFADRRIHPRQQDHTRATYTTKISPEMARMHWKEKSATELVRQVRAMSPFPGAWFEMDGERWKVGTVEIGFDTDAEPGTILQADCQAGFRVACRDCTSLVLVKIQRPGKGMVASVDFLRGLHRDLQGRVLP